ncbi:MAG TPA: hypothetical protein VJ761_17790 [Ktedonobacteraceae bacterium]|nr:hypothetical protein [Ktedonobacteraceae bacterium]
MSSVWLHSHQVFDLASKTSTAGFEQYLGALLALEANDLAAFFEEGWSVNELLAALRPVLQGVQAMSKITRRKVLELGAAAVLSSIAVPSGRHVSAEERVKLQDALGESIGASWKLVQTSSSNQILVLGHAHLCLLQQAGSQLHPGVQPLLYSGVYRLIGAALHFQGFYEDAYRMHEKAYLTALEGGDVWNMAQSRMWQAEALKARERYAEALQTTEAASRLISAQSDVESIRTRADILASSAEVAALMGDEKEVQSKLSSSEKLLDYLSDPHEEFDRAGWYQVAGVCAIHLKQNDLAVKQLQQAREFLPPQWILHNANTLMALVTAYAFTGEQNASFEAVEEVIPLIKTLNAPGIARQFVQYINCALLESFPNDTRVKALLIDKQQQLLPIKSSVDPGRIYN